MLDDATYDSDAAATAGTVSFASPNLTWTGNLAAGTSATITFSVTVNNPDTGDKILVDTMTSATAGSNCPAGSTDARCTSTVTVLVPGLEIAASAGQQHDGAGVCGALHGDGDQLRPDPVHRRHLHRPPGSTCPPSDPAPACTAAVTVQVPALTITKTATVAATTPGTTLGYTITVDDTGQTPYTAATVTDDLTGVLADATYNHNATATTGTLSYTSPHLTWTGNLTPGTTATITYTVTVNNPDTGSGAMSNTVVSTVPGSTCPAGSASPACSVTVAVVAGPLAITAPATASLGSAAPGGTLSAGLGTVQVTDDRGFGAGWTATVAASGFATGTGTPAETIPAADAQYVIAALATTIGSATFTPVPTTQLSATPQPVVTATNVNGNTTVTWDPIINVTIPGSAVGGDYTATITHSVS